MATVRREFFVEAPADAFWSAVRDVGAVHTRLAPGFVTDSRMEGETRVLTFFNAMVAREPIVTIDDAQRRLAYTAQSERVTHYGASLQVFPDGERSRAVWIIDVLPHEAAGPVGQMADAGVKAMQKAAGNSS